MAEIQKQKEKELADAKAAAIDPDEFEQAVEEKTNPKIEIIMQRLDNNSKMSLKPCYSRPVYYARHLKNMHKLNDFLGRNLLKSTKFGDQDSQFSDDQSVSVAPDFFERYQKGNLTYKMLLDHIEIAENNYEATREDQKKQRKNNNTSRDFGEDLLRNNSSALRMMNSQSRFWMQIVETHNWWFNHHLRLLSLLQWYSWVCFGCWRCLPKEHLLFSHLNLYSGITDFTVFCCIEISQVAESKLV